MASPDGLTCWMPKLTGLLSPLPQLETLSCFRITGILAPFVVMRFFLHKDVLFSPRQMVEFLCPFLP